MAEIQLLGLFHDVNQVAEAVEGLRQAGVPDQSVSVLSGAPYKPQMLNRPHPTGCVGRMAFLGAILGVLTAGFLTAGIWLLYTLNQGSQPSIPIPPTLIVIFELTMLGTMWTAFFSMLSANRFPVFKQRAYHPDITAGSIGVVVEADESLAAQIEAVFTNAGGYHVERVAASPRVDVGQRRFWAIVLGGGAALIVISLLFFYDVLHINFPSQMIDQESVAYLQGPRLAAPSAAIPIQGPVLIDGQPASAPVSASADSLQRGQVLFSTICAMCHGAGGQGNGPVSGFFNPKPADLTGSTVQGLADNQIFLVLTQGFGIMPSMAENLSVQDRWDVINHVRTLGK